MKVKLFYFFGHSKVLMVGRCNQLFSFVAIGYTFEKIFSNVYSLASFSVSCFDHPTLPFKLAPAPVELNSA